jgi:HAD superfamily hydrolase (TIGR01509 family)
VTPAAVVFDFDGTIADTEWPVYVIVRDAFREHGLDLTVDDWVDEIGRADNLTLEERLEQALGGPPDPAVLAAARDRRRAARREMGILPGVLEVLDAVAAAGLPLAIASSSPLDWVEDHLHRLGLLGRFAAIRTRDHVDRGKPAPDLYLSAAAAVGVDPGDVVAIEDSRHGCTAAKSAGMTCVVVPNRITTHDRPDHADLVLDSLLEFPFAAFGLG